MSAVSALSIVRNEEVLIAHHLIALSHWSDDVVCVVQPSADATVMIARHVAGQLEQFRVSVRVVEHAPDPLGKEFSMAFGLGLCRHDWVLNVDADESYLGVAPQQIVERLPPSLAVVRIPRWQAVARGRSEWFKTEEWHPKARLLNRHRLHDVQWGLHVPIESSVAPDAVADLDTPFARLVEYKAPWQHYAAQLFYRSQDAMNEAERCEREISPSARAIGRALYDRTIADGD